MNKQQTGEPQDPFASVISNRHDKCRFAAMRFAVGAIALFLSLVSTASWAQQQAMYTQYMFNGLAINPAYAGSQDALSITALGRKQWLGFDGAPSTETFSVHSPVGNRKIAWGMLLSHDHIGVTDQYAIYGMYAYRLKLAKGTLASGLQVGVDSYRAGLSKVLVRQSGDDFFAFDDVQGMLPNFGVGLYYSTRRFYSGFSLPRLLTNVYPGDNKSRARQYQHWFFTTGYVFDINRDLKLKPNLLVKAVQGAPIEFDINANLLIKETFWVGLSYRSFASISGLVEFQATNQFRFGYAYDYGLTELNRSHGGSHELMLNYQLRFKKTKIVSPRYFPRYF